MVRQCTDHQKDGSEANELYKASQKEFWQVGSQVTRNGGGRQNQDGEKDE